MATVDISSESYPSFSDLANAGTYLAGDISLAAPWLALDDDAKGRALVTATRLLLRQSWKDGLPSIDSPPQAVIDATSEFAGAIAAGYDLGTDAASVLPVRRQKAGSVEVEYFRNFDVPLYQPPPLPKPVWDLIKPLLKQDGGTVLAGSIASGVHGCSIPDSYIGGQPGFLVGGWPGFGPGDRDFN